MTLAIAMALFKIFSQSSVDHGDFESEEKTAEREASIHQQGPVDVPHSDRYISDGDSISSGNEGLKKAQATTIVWTRTALIVAYALYVAISSTERTFRVLTISSIFLIFFVNSLSQQISGRLLPYVTSSFNEHALLSTTTVMSLLIPGVIKLPVAKLMDIFGRIQGFVSMVICTVVG